MGIVSSGTGVGGLVWAPALSACIGRIEFRNTLRLTGTLSTVILCLSATVLDWEPTTAAHLHSEKAVSPGRSRLWRIPMPSLATFRERRLIMQAIAAFFPSAAYYIPVMFTVLYCLFSSASVILFSPVLAELFGIQAIPRVSGVMYMIQGRAAIIGTPVADVLKLRGSTYGLDST